MPLKIKQETREIIAEIEAGIQRSKIAEKHGKNQTRIMYINNKFVPKLPQFQKTIYTANDFYKYGENQGYINKLETVKKEYKSSLSKQQYHKLNNRYMYGWFLEYMKGKVYITRKQIYSAFLDHLNMSKNKTLGHEEITVGINHRFVSFIRRALQKKLIKKYNKYTYEVLATEEKIPLKNITIKFTTEVNNYEMTKDLMRYMIKNYSTIDHKIIGEIDVNGIKQDIRWA